MSRVERFLWQPLGTAICTVYVWALESADRVVCRFANETHEEER